MSKRELFRILVASHYRDLLGFIIYCLRKRNFRPQTAIQVAEDMAAEVILVAWQKQDDFVKSEGLHEGDLAVQFRAWLHSIAKNKISESIRRNASEQRHYRAFADEADALEDVFFEPSVGSGTFDENLAHLRGCLEKQSTDHREILHQRYIEGLTCVEMARQRGVEQGAMRQLVHRLLHRLRMCIEEKQRWAEAAHG